MAQAPKWTLEEDTVLRERYPHESAAATAAVLGRGVAATYARAAKLGVAKSPEYLASEASGRLRKDDERKNSWSAKEDALMRERYPFESAEAVAAALGPQRTKTAVYARARTLQIEKAPEFLASAASGRLDGSQGAGTRFATGNVPWTKGKTGLHQLGGATRFQKGAQPANWMPIGSTRLHDKSYTWIKVSDEGGGFPHGWQPLHRVLWEQAHGIIPKDHLVAFKDGNPQHIELDNLELVSKKDWAIRHSLSNPDNYPPELAELIRTQARLMRLIKESEASEK